MVAEVASRHCFLLCCQAGSRDLRGWRNSDRNRRLRNPFLITQPICYPGIKKDLAHVLVSDAKQLANFGARVSSLRQRAYLVRFCLEVASQKVCCRKIVVPPEIAWKIAMSLPIMHRTLVLLAAGTGMRMSELLGLRWCDIDFTTKKIMLNQTWVYGRIENGKTAESREPVVLGDRTTGFLVEWHRQTPYAGKGDWVFASNKLRGARPISGSHFVKDYIRPRFVEHGLIDADYTGRAGLYAFRHSLATVLIVEENVDPKTAQSILRHTDAGLTMNIYTHAQDPAKRAALEKFESRLVN